MSRKKPCIAEQHRWHQIALFGCQGRNRLPKFLKRFLKRVAKKDKRLWQKGALEAGFKSVSRWLQASNDWYQERGQLMDQRFVHAKFLTAEEESRLGELERLMEALEMRQLGLDL